MGTECAVEPTRRLRVSCSVLPRSTLNISAGACVAPVSIATTRPVRTTRRSDRAGTRVMPSGTAMTSTSVPLPGPRRAVTTETRGSAAERFRGPANLLRHGLRSRLFSASSAARRSRRRTHRLSRNPRSVHPRRRGLSSRRIEMRRMVQTQIYSVHVRFAAYRVFDEHRSHLECIKEPKCVELVLR